MTEQDIIKVFHGCTSRDEFRLVMKTKFGFTMIQTSNKSVFLRDDLDFVVKFVTGWDFIPGRKTKIAKYYLFPYIRRKKKLNWMRYDKLHFQKKVDRTDSPKILAELKAILRRERIYHSWDCGEHNIGRFNGSPVIIDY